MTDGLAAELARQMSARGPVDVTATVSSVNPDGTVNITLRGATVPSLPAMTGYTNRAIGDRVLVRVRGAQMVVLGKTGAGLELADPADITVSDSAAPGGAGWQEIQKVWGIPATNTAPAQLWLQRTTPYVPPPPTAPNPATLTVTAVDVDTYRGGSRINQGKGEQGDYTGRGLCTGVWVFGSVWGPLAGKTITGCRVTMQRSGSGGFTWGPVPVDIWTHAAASLPASTPALGLEARPGSLQTNQQDTFDLGAGFGQWLRDNGGGLAIFTGNARENLETQGAFTVAVDYY